LSHKKVLLPGNLGNGWPYDFKKASLKRKGGIGGGDGGANLGKDHRPGSRKFVRNTGHPRRTSSRTETFDNRAARTGTETLKHFSHLGRDRSEEKPGLTATSREFRETRREGSQCPKEKLFYPRTRCLGPNPCEASRELSPNSPKGTREEKKIHHRIGKKENNQKKGGMSKRNKGRSGGRRTCIES